MNLKHLTAVRDAFEKAPCKGYKGGAGEKQQIPGRFKAERYAISATPKYYLDYLHGHHPHPYITGVYYCPFCGKWHPTTDKGGASAHLDRLREQIEQVKTYQEKPDYYPSDGIVAEDFNWPEWTEEEVTQIIELVDRLSPQQRSEYYKFTLEAIATPYKL